MKSTVFDNAITSSKTSSPLFQSDKPTVNSDAQTDVFHELAEYRRSVGLPAAGTESDRATVATLEIGDSRFLGVSSGSNPSPRKITLRVNPISKTHAEADAIQQAYDAGIRGGIARLIVDRDLCRACGQNGGVKGMAKQLGLEELEVISPSGRTVIKLN